MARGFRFGGAGGEKPYTSEGLTPLNDRCIVKNGGFRLNENVVEIDVTIQVTQNLSANWGILGGFPEPVNPSTSGIITPTHNNLAIYNDAPPVSLVSLMATSSISSGTELRFIGSYTWR